MATQTIGMFSPTAEKLEYLRAKFDPEFKKILGKDATFEIRDFVDYMGGASGVQISASRPKGKGYVEQVFHVNMFGFPSCSINVVQELVGGDRRSNLPADLAALITKFLVQSAHARRVTMLLYTSPDGAREAGLGKLLPENGWTDLIAYRNMLYDSDYKIHLMAQPAYPEALEAKRKKSA